MSYNQRGNNAHQHSASGSSSRSIINDSQRQDPPPRSNSMNPYAAEAVPYPDQGYYASDAAAGGPSSSTTAQRNRFQQFGSSVAQGVRSGAGNIKQGAVSSAKYATKGAKMAGKSGMSLRGAFIKFIDKGNFVEIATGLMLATAMTALIASFNANIIMPLIAAMGTQGSFDNYFVVMRCAPGASVNGTAVNVNSPLSDFKNQFAVANAAGCTTWNYGAFIQSFITFMITAIVLFGVLRLVQMFYHKKEATKATAPCRFCKEDCKLEALLCPHCHSHDPIEKVEIVEVPTEEVPLKK